MAQIQGGGLVLANTTSPRTSGTPARTFSRTARIVAPVVNTSSTMRGQPHHNRANPSNLGNNLHRRRCKARWPAAPYIHRKALLHLSFCEPLPQSLRLPLRV